MPRPSPTWSRANDRLVITAWCPMVRPDQVIGRAITGRIAPAPWERSSAVPKERVKKYACSWRIPSSSQMVASTSWRVRRPSGRAHEPRPVTAASPTPAPPGCREGPSSPHPGRAPCFHPPAPLLQRPAQAGLLQHRPAPASGRQASRSAARVKPFGQLRSVVEGTPPGRGGGVTNAGSWNGQAASRRDEPVDAPGLDVVPPPFHHHAMWERRHSDGPHRHRRRARHPGRAWPGTARRPGARRPGHQVGPDLVVAAVGEGAAGVLHDGDPPHPEEPGGQDQRAEDVGGRLGPRRCGGSWRRPGPSPSMASGSMRLSMQVTSANSLAAGAGMPARSKPAA